MEAVTRSNFEALLDAGQLCVMASPGRRCWRVRRNGKTQTWKSDPGRIRVPIKTGLKGYLAIEERHFDRDGNLDPAWFNSVSNLDELGIAHT